MAPPVAIGSGHATFGLEDFDAAPLQEGGNTASAMIPPPVTQIEPATVQAAASPEVVVTGQSLPSTPPAAVKGMEIQGDKPVTFPLDHAPDDPGPEQVSPEPGQTRKRFRLFG